MPAVSIQRFLPFAVTLAAAVVLGATEPSANTIEFQSLDLPEGHFRCEVPKTWGLDRDEREEARIHYCGVFLYGPREESGLRATLSIRFFAPDNTMFRGAEGYLQRQLGPSLVKPAKEVTSEPRNVTVAGQPGKSFTRDTVDFFPPDSLDTKEIPVREEYYVVSHLGGFVVIKFAAPTAVLAERRVVLQRLLDTLRLLPERVVIVVRMNVDGLDGEQIEAKVTQPLEATFAGIPHLMAMSSISQTAESVVRLELDAVAGLEPGRQEIERRLALAQDRLALGAVTTIGSPVADDVPPWIVTLSATGPSRLRPIVLGELNALAERVLRNRLASLPGVAEVRPPADRQCIEIAPALERLATHDIDTLELLAAVKANGNASDKTLPVDSAQTQSPDDLRRRVVAFRNGDPVRVGDVADVRLGVIEAPREQDVGSTSVPDKRAGGVSVTFAVQPLASADSGAVGRAVEQVLSDVRVLLPEGFQLELSPGRKVEAGFRIMIAGKELAILYDQAVSIQRSLDGITGIVDLRIEPQLSTTNRLELNRDAAERYGFTEAGSKAIEELARKIRDRLSLTKTNGPNGLPIDILIDLGDKSTMNLGALPFHTPAGERIPLRAVVTLSATTDPKAIAHQNGQRFVNVSGRIVGREPETVLNDVQAVCQESRLPAGYSVKIDATLLNVTRVPRIRVVP